jgi:hypothetical protein
MGRVLLVVRLAVRDLRRRPAEAVMVLLGWRDQQLSRNLGEATVRRRLEGVRRFQRFTNDWPWRWRPVDLEEFTAQLRGELANCAIYSSTLDLTHAAKALTADGWHIDPDDLATVTPLHHHRHPPLRRLGAQPHPARRDRRRAPGPRPDRLSPLVQQEPSGPGGGGMAERRASRSFPAGHPRPRRSAGCQGSAQPAAMRHFR